MSEDVTSGPPFKGIDWLKQTARRVVARVGILHTEWSAAWSLLLPAIKQQVPLRATLILFMSIGSSFILAIGPALIKGMVDSVSSRAPATLVGLMVIYASSQYLNRLVSLRIVKEYGIVSRSIRLEVARSSYIHLLNICYAEAIRIHPSKAQRIVTDGLVAVRQILSTVLFSFVPLITQSVIAGWVLWKVGDEYITGIYIIFLLVYVNLARQSRPEQRTSQKTTIDAEGAASKLITDALASYEVIRAYDAGGAISKRIESLLLTAANASGGIGDLLTRRGSLLGLASVLCSTSIILVVGLRCIHGSLSPSLFVLINLYVVQIMAPAQKAVSADNQLSQALYNVASLAELRRLPLEERSVLADSQRQTLCIALDKVTVKSPEGTTILKDIELKLRCGRRVAIVGPTGAGKSTLIRVMCGLLSPDHGEVHFSEHGSDCRSQRPAPRVMALVPQDCPLMDDTLEMNLTLGDDFERSEIDRAVQVADLEAVIRRSPDGLQQAVGVRGNKLSGGERQRVGIARAFLRKPAFYALDEATSALDSVTEFRVLNNIYVGDRTCGIVAIAHRLNTIQDFDEIIVLDKGKVVDVGNHKALLRKSDLYKTMWLAQTKERLDEDGNPSCLP